VRGEGFEMAGVIGGTKTYRVFIDWRSVELVLACGHDLRLDLINVVVWSKCCLQFAPESNLIFVVSAGFSSDGVWPTTGILPMPRSLRKVVPRG
jgi:hypothetical protein